MKKIIAVAMLLFSSNSFADPTIFNMELGGTTEAQFKSMYSAQSMGTNKYTSGNMYSVTASDINFEGLQKVTTIFNEKGVLVAVLTTFQKSKFDYLHQALGGKYKLVSQKIPFVGNKSAIYRDGGTEIALEAPHMSFEMSMNYIRDDLKRVFDQQSGVERRQKQQSDAAQL